MNMTGSDMDSAAETTLPETLTDAAAAGDENALYHGDA
jgi:hypothetical protein